MIDMSHFVGFEWDDGNDRKSVSKHAVTTNESEQVFVDKRVKVTNDARHSQNEVRYHALGRTVEGRLLHVTFTLRHGQSKIRMISARDASRKERMHYEQEA